MPTKTDYPKKHDRLEAISVLKEAIQFLEGKRRSKPTCWNCDAIDMVARSLESVGIK